MFHSVTHPDASLIDLTSLHQVQVQMPITLGVPPHATLKAENQVTWSQIDTPLKKHELILPTMLSLAICMESL